MARLLKSAAACMGIGGALTVISEATSGFPHGIGIEPAAYYAGRVLGSAVVLFVLFLIARGFSLHRPGKS